MKKKKGIINQYNLLGVIIQFVVTVVVLIFGVLSLFNHHYYSSLELATSIDLFVMAYNNQKVYHTKNVTYLYLLFGIILLVSFILTKIGVL